MAGVAYTVTYTNAFAVAAVAAHVTLIDAPVGSAAVTQSWSVAFSPLSAGAEARSGNPGESPVDSIFVCGLLWVVVGCCGFLSFAIFVFFFFFGRSTLLPATSLPRNSLS